MTCITGDETGLIKLWDIKHSSSAILIQTIGRQDRVNSIEAMCWRDVETTTFATSMRNGDFKIYEFDEEHCAHERGSSSITCYAALPNALAFMNGKYILVGNNGDVISIDEEFNINKLFTVEKSIDAVHIHSKYQLLALGGKGNELHIYDLSCEHYEKPIFVARPKHNKILDAAEPTFVTGVCIINPFVYCTSSAFHQVEFYDRRVNAKPIYEYPINREVERRPTRMLQWNSNKFLIGEASGDVHLYDTRRGFTSRAKLRGGVGSVRCMTKHPSAIQLLAVTGLDRKARIYHVPTGKLLMSIYTKQRCNCVLMNKELPMTNNMESYRASANTKRTNVQGLGDELWDNMDPVIDLWESTISENYSPEIIRNNNTNNINKKRARDKINW